MPDYERTEPYFEYSTEQKHNIRLPSYEEELKDLKDQQFENIWLCVLIDTFPIEHDYVSSRDSRKLLQWKRGGLILVVTAADRKDNDARRNEPGIAAMFAIVQ